jgi:ribosome biogenesis protein YTM1
MKTSTIPSPMQAEAENHGKMVPVVLKTKTTYQIPSDTFMLPLNWRRFHLSQLINKVLDLPNPVPFDFIINGELLSNTVGEWCSERNIGEICEQACP